MKRIAVICNNDKEWKHFTECMMWNLAKQNSPYKLSRNTLVDIQNNQEFIHLPNNMYKLDQILYMLPDDFTIDDVIYMCKYNQEIQDFLTNNKKESKS